MSTAAVKPRPAAAVPNGEQPKRLSLKDAIKGGKGLPSRVILHGDPGIGKTSLAAHAPKPFFLLTQGETGLHTLIDNGQLPEIPNIEVPEWEDALAIIEDLRTGDHDYKSLVIDALDGAEKMANSHALKNQFKGNAGSDKGGFLCFADGSRFVASVPWPELLIALDRLRSERQMAIIGLAHTHLALVQNADGPDYNRNVPDMYKDVWALTQGWADIVLYCHHEIYTSKDKLDRRAKASGGSIRMMQTVKTATADAKNRHGLTEEIPMGETGQEGWANFIEAIKTARAAKTQE